MFRQRQWQIKASKLEPSTGDRGLAEIDLARKDSSEKRDIMWVAWSRWSHTHGHTHTYTHWLRWSSNRHMEKGDTGCLQVAPYTCQNWQMEKRFALNWEAVSHFYQFKSVWRKNNWHVSSIIGTRSLCHAVSTSHNKTESTAALSCNAVLWSKRFYKTIITVKSLRLKGYVYILF